MKILCICATALLFLATRASAKTDTPRGAPEPKGTLIEFHAKDASPSVKLRGILSLPKTTGTKAPVVLMIWGSTCDNGTGWIPASDTASGKDEAIFSDIRGAFLKQGVATFTYTKRGCSPEHGGTQDKSIRVTATRSNLLADAKAAFEALRSNASIDREQVFILGYSEGNTYAWELGLANPGQIRGLLLVALISGRYIAAEYNQQVVRRLDAFNTVDENHDGKVTKSELNRYECYASKNYLQFDECDSNRDHVLSVLEFRACRERRWLHFINAVETTPAGQFTEDSKDPAEWYREHYRSKSMVETIAGQSTPVAIFQGEADIATPLYEAVVLKEELTRAGKPPFLYRTYPGMSHGLAMNSGRRGHCQKFGPVDSKLLEDLTNAIGLRLQTPLPPKNNTFTHKAPKPSPSPSSAPPAILPGPR